jgi:hypothetical protein
MNPLAIESALKSALAASAFPTAAIYTGTSFEEIAPETLNLIVGVDQLTTVGIGLYTATATIKLTAPALIGADSYDSFSEALDDLKTALTQTYLLANWPTADAPNLAGSYLTSISTGQDNNAWTADLTVTLGVRD